MKKTLSIVVLLFLTMPVLANGQGLVPCNGPDCTIGSFFLMLANIYWFIVWWLATPLAVIAITVGGIFILISAGNPNLASTGKNILRVAIIGLVLALCSWLIIDFILNAIGYNVGRPWWQL